MASDPHHSQRNNFCYPLTQQIRKLRLREIFKIAQVLPSSKGQDLNLRTYKPELLPLPTAAWQHKTQLEPLRSSYSTALIPPMLFPSQVSTWVPLGPSSLLSSLPSSLWEQHALPSWSSTLKAEGWRPLLPLPPSAWPRQTSHWKTLRPPDKGSV